MANSNFLLSSYQALVQNHASQFDPKIITLQQLVEQRMQDLSQQEQALVEAQVVKLQDIIDALATDARCFLPTREFSAFVQELKKAPRDYWYSQKFKDTFADDPTTWLLATLNLPVSVSNYKTHEDPNGYDDERTYIRYSYSLVLKLGNAERQIEVPYKRIYNVNEQIDSSLREQIDYYISSEAKDLLREIGHSEAERTHLCQEVGNLVGYATTLFALKPRTATFIYPSTQEK